MGNAERQVGVTRVLLQVHASGWVERDEVTSCSSDAYEERGGARALALLNLKDEMLVKQWWLTGEQPTSPEEVMPSRRGKRAEAGYDAIRLEDTDLVGNVQGVLVSGQSDECLLLSVGADEGVDVGSLNVVQLLEGGLDLPLVGGTGNDEDKSVDLLDLLHGRLGVEREEDGLVGVHARGMGDRLAWVLGLAGQLEGVGAVEADRGSHLADLLARGTLEGGLLGGSGLDGLWAGLSLADGWKRG